MLMYNKLYCLIVLIYAWNNFSTKNFSAITFPLITSTMLRPVDQVSKRQWHYTELSVTQCRQLKKENETLSASLWLCFSTNPDDTIRLCACGKVHRMTPAFHNSFNGGFLDFLLLQILVYMQAFLPSSNSFNNLYHSVAFLSIKGLNCYIHFHLFFIGDRE